MAGACKCKIQGVGTSIHQTFMGIADLEVSYFSPRDFGFGSWKPSNKFSSVKMSIMIM